VIPSGFFRLVWSVPFLGVLAGLPPSQAHGAECTAARTMDEDARELALRKDELQRREWLLFEFLSHDKARASRALYEKEIAQSLDRISAAAALNAEVAALPPGAAESEEGSAECETLTRAKQETDELIDVRTVEIDAYYDKQFPFLKGCDQIADALVIYARRARDPQATPETMRLAKVGLPIVLGPAMNSSRLSLDGFDDLADAAVEAPELADATRRAYLALSCLKSYQGQARDLKGLSDAGPALTRCDTSHWIELGTCVSAAAFPVK
jgi:hypothetical protein